jgi:CP family cyanate transporter-like MFS transporter
LSNEHVSTAVSGTSEPAPAPGTRSAPVPGVFATTGTVGILLAAACMRPAITSVGPLLDQIGRSVPLSHTLLGLLSSLPLLCFAVVSPLVHGPARRFGVERGILWALVVLTVGIVVRSAAGLVGLWAGTVVIGSGVAVLNVLMPVVVKSRYAARVALVTGLYSAALGTAAAVASGVSLPLSRLPGGWRLSLGVWAVLTLAVAVTWARTVHRDAAVGRRAATTDRAQSTGSSRHPVWRSAAAWRITLFMGLQSTTFYIVVSWFPAIAVDRDVSPGLAGWYLFAAQIIGIGSGLALPTVLTRLGRGVAGIALSVPMLAAAVGLILAPGVMPLWVVLIGLSTGAALVLSLSMIGLAGKDARHGAQLSGMVQAVAYAMAAAGPVVAGWLRDTTGSWDATLLLIAAISVAQAVVTAVRGRGAAR